MPLVASSSSDDEVAFVSQEDDSQNLWEVIAIVDEKRGRFKVQWAGTDPQTKEPWPNSWVGKNDVTSDLVKEWKEKRASKKGRAEKSGMYPKLAFQQPKLRGRKERAQRLALGHPGDL
jgi:hypothetical protein